MTYRELVSEIKRLSLDERLRLLELLSRSVRDELAHSPGADAPVERPTDEELAGLDVERYLDRLGPDDIRITGSRIGIQSVLAAYLHRARSPEQIAERYPTLRLDQVYAVILYYLRNREAIDDYLARWTEREERALAAQASDAGFGAFEERLRQERARRAGASA
jgi:uncharacterized protein (DUF433 family)